jgi:hypothetical protein
MLNTFVVPRTPRLCLLNARFLFIKKKPMFALHDLYVSNITMIGMLKRSSNHSHSTNEVSIYDT